MSYLKSLIIKYKEDSLFKSKCNAAIVILALFILFVSGFAIFGKPSYDVLKVENPFEISVDINHDGDINDGETISVAAEYDYISRENLSGKTINSKYNLDFETLCAFGYLTEKYVNDLLLDKKVFLKRVGDKYEIYLNGEKYIDILLKSGYLFQNGNPVNVQAYKKRLEQIKKANYKIYNTKSNKYHELTCEYGLKAHSYVILSRAQLPKGASPCQACHPNTGSKTHPKHKDNKTHSKVDIKPPSMSYSSGAIKIFVTDHTRKLKPDRFGDTQICNELVNQINSAKTSIDIAIYGYDSTPKIENAIKRAIERGVKIRLVHDIDSKGGNIYEHTNKLASIIKNTSCDRAPSNMNNGAVYTNSIMHNKFYVFDNSTVICGSANLSFTDMSGFNSNCVLLIRSKKIANIYTQEFEQMYNSKFHYLKSKIPDKENIQLGSSVISVYFSPKDEITKNVLVPLINRAEKYIYMPVFLITDNQVVNALIFAKSRGVDVKVIVDATNASNNYSKHRVLREHGILVKTENYAGKLHSKSAIVDDKYSLIGSMNFSRSGEHKNDENMVLIKDFGITKFYKTYFSYLWSRISDYWLTHDCPAESVYSIGSCSDGIDNDYDGKTDMEDEGCRFKPVKK